ncbi:MAG: cphB [Bacteroidota bacterium]|nr:cphB [Bacteroidota bacterium]
MAGIIIPIGGNEDKGFEVKNEKYTLEFIDKGILWNVVKESGGKDAKIVVITTASNIPVEVGENYFSAFTKLGCHDISILSIIERAQSEDPEILKLIENANCVMFSGGDQSKIIDIIGGSSIHNIINNKMKGDNFVLAGTSAGAMCMSEHMISGGSSTEALVKDSVHMRGGMSFLKDVIIDTHFIQRGRFGRLTEAVAKFPKLLGLGLAEDTAIIIRNCNECEVIGSGMVIMFDPGKLVHNNVAILKPGLPVSITNLTVNVLANGDKFFLDSRATQILTLEEYDTIESRKS